MRMDIKAALGISGWKEKCCLAHTLLCGVALVLRDVATLLKLGESHMLSSSFKRQERRDWSIGT
jgi:hypothetical protein